MSELELALKTRKHIRKVLTRVWSAMDKLDTSKKIDPDRKIGTVRKLGSSNVDPSAAQAAGIRLCSMSLEEDSDQQPIYFVPFMEAIERIEDENDEKYPTYTLKYAYRCSLDLDYFLERYTKRPMWEEYAHPPGIYYKDSGDSNFGALYEDDGWYVISTCPAYPKALGLPHMKWWIYSEVEGREDQLTRGEILSITRVMRGRLQTKSLLPHVIAPALVFSVVDTMRVRVLESYFDGKQLIVRMTKLYDMKEYDEKTMNLLLRWWLGYAVGETKTLPNPLRL